MGVPPTPPPLEIPPAVGNDSQTDQIIKTINRNTFFQKKKKTLWQFNGTPFVLNKCVFLLTKLPNG